MLSTCWLLLRELCIILLTNLYKYFIVNFWENLIQDYNNLNDFNYRQYIIFYLQNIHTYNKTISTIMYIKLIHELGILHIIYLKTVELLHKCSYNSILK